MYEHPDNIIETLIARLAAAEAGREAAEKHLARAGSERNGNCGRSFR